MACEPRDSTALLTANDPPPVAIVNPDGGSPFLLIGDHAGNRVPVALGDLGLPPAERVRHIAWDIGVGGLGELLAERLDAVFVRQVYSRLVVDCNRGRDAPDAIAPVSDGTVVPGNADLSPEASSRRFAEIHEPYQQAIAAEIARRQAAGMTTVLVSLHSFTPVMRGFARPWQVGLLYDRGDTRVTLAVLDLLRRDGRWEVGDNEPYAMDGTDHTVPRHAYPAGLAYVEFEVRQDLIADAAGQGEWAETLAGVLSSVRLE